MLVHILDNISTNDDNRRQLYRAELVLRTLQFQGIVRHPPDNSEASTVLQLPPLTPRAPGDMTSRSEPSHPSAPMARSSTLKAQYLQWLGSVMDDAGSEDELSGVEGAPSNAVLERLHSGQPVVHTAPGRRFRRQLEERVEGGTGLLPRLLRRPMGSTWREQIGGVDLKAPFTRCDCHVIAMRLLADCYVIAS